MPEERLHKCLALTQETRALKCTHLKSKRIDQHPRVNKITMTPAEREYLLTQLAEARQRMLRTLRGLSREQLCTIPKPDASVVLTVEVAASIQFVLFRPTYRPCG